MADRNRHQDYQNDLLALKGKITELISPDTYGIVPVLTAEDITVLKELYRKVFRSAGAYLNTVRPDDGEEEKRASRACGQVQESILKDLSALEKAKPGQSFADIIHAARTRKVDVTGRQLQTAGYVLSQRYPMTVTDDDGTQMKGFFTKRITLDVDETLERERHRCFAVYPELANELNVLFEELRKPGRETLENKIAFLEQYSSQPGAPIEGAVKEILGELQGVERRKEDYERIGGDTSKTTVDTRSIAMSRVASLLGCEDILAKSVPMQIVDFGRATEGTFIEFAQGIDYGDGEFSAQANAFVPTSFDCTDALRQMSDLTVLDYVCNNTDRHGGNIIYRLDDPDAAEPKLTGIVGIDNDMSFGTEAGRGLVRNSGLNAISNISKSMYDKVMSLDMNVLRHSFYDLGLGKEHVFAVVDRIDRLKEKLEEGKVEVIADEEYKKRTFASLLPPRGEENVFTVIDRKFGARNWKNRSEEHNKSRQKKLHQSSQRPQNRKKAAEPFRLFEGKDRNLIASDTDILTDKLNRITLAQQNVRNGSPQYIDVQTAAARMLELTRAYREDSGKTLNDEEIQNIQTAYRQTADACMQYLKHKKEDGHINASPESKPGKRVAAVRELLGFCANRVNALEDVLDGSYIQEVRDLKTEADRLVQERFSQMEPAEVGQYLKSLNEMAARPGNNDEAKSRLGGLIEQCGAYIQKLCEESGTELKEAQEKFGLERQDLLDAKAHIEAGRKANAKLSADKEPEPLFDPNIPNVLRH